MSIFRKNGKENVCCSRLTGRRMRAKSTGTGRRSGHADWVEEFLPKYGFTAGSGLEGEITPERLHEIVQTEIGLVFKEVLTDAGVYKCTEEGRAAFMRFVDTVNA